jgi:radical SAM protein with 4Fe4S-binding SPASM domain
VLADALADVWQHPTLNAIRSDLPAQLQGVCGRCLLNARCLGNCIAQNVYRSSDLFAANWFCESAEQAGLFPASRLL